MMHANTTRDYLYIENASKMIIEISKIKIVLEFLILDQVGVIA